MVGPVSPADPLQPVRPVEGFQSGAPVGGFRGSAVKPSPTRSRFPGIKPEKIEPIQGVPADPVSSPYENPPVETSGGFSGWVSNLGKDVKEFVSGLLLFPVVTAENVATIVKNYDWLDDIFDESPDGQTFFRKALDDQASAVWRGFADTYKDGIGEALYRRPFTVLLDATMAFDLAGAAVKAGSLPAQLAMRARLVGKLEKEAVKAAARAGIEATPDLIRAYTKVAPMRAQRILSRMNTLEGKLFRLGESIQRAPRKLVSPAFRTAAKAAEALPGGKRIGNAVRKIGAHFALDAKGLAESRRYGEILLRARARVAPFSLDLIKSKIPKEAWGEFDQAIIGHIKDGDVSNEVARVEAGKWNKIQADIESHFRELQVFPEETLEAGKLKNLILYHQSIGILPEGLLKTIPGEGFEFSKEAFDWARKWVAEKGTNPRYAPLTHELSWDLETFLDNLSTPNRAAYTSASGRMKRKTGADVLGSDALNPLSLGDPVFWRAKSMMQSVELVATAEYAVDVTRRLGIPFKGLNPPAGYVKLPPGIAKYSQILADNHALIGREVAEKLAVALPENRLEVLRSIIQGKASIPLAEAGKLGYDEFLAAVKNPSEWGIAIPKQAAFIMQGNMMGAKGMLAIYDKFINTWRDLVLTLMPRYYINNLVGNSVLLLFGGYSPFHKLPKLSRGISPGEVLQGGMIQAEGGARSSGLFDVIPDKIRLFSMKLNETIDVPAREALTGIQLEEVIKGRSRIGDSAVGALIRHKRLDEIVTEIAQARPLVRDISIAEMREAKQLGKSLVEARASRVAELKGIDGQIKELKARIGQAKSLSTFYRGFTAKFRIRELEDQVGKLLKKRGEEFPLSKIPSDIPAKFEVMRDIQTRRSALQPLADMAEEGVRGMETWLGNYGRLHPIERNIIRRVIPFWTFMRTMTTLVFKLPFLRPKTAFAWSLYSKYLWDSIGDDRLPGRFRYLIPFGGEEDGTMHFINFRGLNVFDAAGFADVGGFRIPKMFDISQNPLVSLIVESKGGFDVFTERPYTRKTDVVTFWGSVWRFDPALGRFETIIPQSNILEGLMDLIPHARIAREMLDVIPATRGLAGVTAKGPDGTYMYNRQWWWALSRAFGFPVTVANPEKVKARHSRQIRDIVRRYRFLARTADPDTRAEVVKTLEHMGRDGAVLWED